MGAYHLNKRHYQVYVVVGFKEMIWCNYTMEAVNLRHLKYACKG